MNAKQKAEKLDWLQSRLIELANQEPEDIESNEFDIYGEDEFGREGCTSAQITETAQEAFDVIENLLKELEATERKLAEAEKVVEAVRKFNKETEPTPPRFEQFCAGQRLVKALSDYEASKGCDFKTSSEMKEENGFTRIHITKNKKEKY